MAVIMRIPILLLGALIASTVISLVSGETCPAYCDNDRLYVGSKSCNNGYCCGTHTDMYCCVSYWDRVPTPIPNITSPSDCIVIESGATSLLFKSSPVVIVGISLLLTIVNRIT